MLVLAVHLLNLQPDRVVVVLAQRLVHGKIVSVPRSGSRICISLMCVLQKAHFNKKIDYAHQICCTFEVLLMLMLYGEN